jgi:hypothetical protein
MCSMENTSYAIFSALSAIVSFEALNVACKLYFPAVRRVSVKEGSDGATP